MGVSPNVIQQVNSYSVARPYHGILLSNKKKQTTDMNNNLDESPRNDAELEEKNLQNIFEMTAKIGRGVDVVTEGQKKGSL